MARPCNILIYTNATSGYDTWSFTDLKLHLESLGNTVTLEDAGSVPDLTTILPGDFSQMWFIDGKFSEDTTLTPEELDAIRDFVDRSRGLAILADQEPHFQIDANLIADEWGVSFDGIRDHSEGMSHTCNSSISFTDHPIANDMGNLFITVGEGRIHYSGSSVFFDVVSTFAGDTLQATYQRGFHRIFFDSCFERYVTSFIWGCGGDTLAQNVSCWLEPCGCLCGITPEITVDSVWFQEEITCNNENLVSICYQLSSNCPERTWDLELMMSTNDGSTWNVPINTLSDADRDTGAVLYGLHCFNWHMDIDYPDFEGEILLRCEIDTSGVILSEEYSSFLDSKPPELTITSTDENLDAGDSYRINWNIDDMFELYSTCSLFFDYSTYSDTVITGLSFYDWSIPEICDSVTLTVAVRDSFCNWSYESTEYVVCHPFDAYINCGPCNEISSCSTTVISYVVKDTLCSNQIDNAFFTAKYFSSASDSLITHFNISSPDMDIVTYPDSFIINISLEHYSDNDSIYLNLDSLISNFGCVSTFGY